MNRRFEGLKVLKAFLPLLVLIFLVGIVVFFLFLFASFSGRKENIMGKYKLVVVGKDGFSKGIAYSSKQLHVDEFMTYKQGDKEILISNFGTTDYQCSGGCYCENEERRNVGTVSGRGVTVLVAAISTVFAFKKAKELQNEHCRMNFFDSCSSGEISSYLDDCEEIEGNIPFEAEDSFENEATMSMDEEIYDPDTFDESESDHSVLFVCFGNICRSPMCEYVFRNIEKSEKWVIDSAGTGNHFAGRPPDPRTTRVLKRHFGKNLKILTRSRAIERDDFMNFDYIMCMDQQNYEDCKHLRDIWKVPKEGAKVQKITDYSKGEWDEIQDPYYYGIKEDQGFEHVYDICMRCCQEFVKQVEGKNSEEKE